MLTLWLFTSGWRYSSHPRYEDFQGILCWKLLSSNNCLLLWPWHYGKQCFLQLKTAKLARWKLINFLVVRELMIIVGFMCQGDDEEMWLLCPLSWTYNYTLQLFPWICTITHFLFGSHSSSFSYTFYMTFMILIFLFLLFLRNTKDRLKDQLKPVPPVPSPSWSHKQRVKPYLSSCLCIERRSLAAGVCQVWRWQKSPVPEVSMWHLAALWAQISGGRTPLSPLHPSLSFLSPLSASTVCVIGDSDSFRFVVVLWYEGLTCPWTSSLPPLSLWCTCQLVFVSVQVHLGPYCMLASIPLRCPSCQTL